MLSLKQKFLTWLQEPRNQSRFIAGVIGVFVLVGVVLFSNQISNLFSLFGGKAAISGEDLAKTWGEVVLSGGEHRAHANLITVEQGNQAWLYIAGGIDVQYNYIESRWQTIMVNSVQRVELDPQTGTVKEKANWEQMPSLNFGHAEFGFVQSGNYLYVVSGDLHTPPEVEGKVPLLYSTIERLNLNNIDAGWEVYALLSGVNFYPEVVDAYGGIQIVGGIYGNPFPLFPNMTVENQTKDMLDEGSRLWGELNLGSKTVVGKTSLYLPYGVIGANIQTGATPSPITGQTQEEIISKPEITIQSSAVKSDVMVQQVSPSGPKIVHPAPSETLQANEDYTIQWAGDDSKWNEVGLYFRTGPEAAWQLIHPNAGTFWNGQWQRTFKWRVGLLFDHYYGGPTTHNAQIKMCPFDLTKGGPDCSSGNEVVMDGAFHFYQEFWINNLTPQGGAHYNDAGSPLTIGWDYHGVNATVKLEYQLDGVWYVIKSNILASEKRYKWYTPNVNGGKTIQIRATISPPSYRSAPYLPGSSSPSGIAVTGPIYLDDLGPSYIEIAKPAGSESWEPGSTQNITWHSNIVDPQKSFNLFYTLNGNSDSPSWVRINPDIVSGVVRSYSWPIPNGLYSEHARIMIVGGGVSTISNEFRIASSIELASLLSKALIDGSFVTTVGEHFIINTNNPALSQAGELGSDYEGTLLDTWMLGKVSHIGHLRFAVVESDERTQPVKSYLVIPVPQGRYGHKLTFVGGTMYVLGGASWAREITIRKTSGSNEVFASSFKSFWVIDDAIHPFWDIPPETNPSYPAFNFGNLGYKFKGNITYQRSGSAGTSWIGSYAGTLNNFVFKNTSGAKEGRAFFGLTSYDPRADSLVAIGGLVNKLSSTGSKYDRYEYHLYSPTRTTQYYRVPVVATAEVERMASGWQSDQSYSYLEEGSIIPVPITVYDIQAFGLDGGVIAYSGQKQFQYAVPLPGTPPPSSAKLFADHDPHVPDFTFEDISLHTAMYIPGVPTVNHWNTMADISEGDADYFSANGLSLVGAASGAPFRTVYRFGGVNPSGTETNVVTNTLRALGPFGAGATIPHHITAVIKPAAVYADNQDSATVTLTVFDYYDNLVTDTEIWLAQHDSNRELKDYVTAAAGWEVIHRENQSFASVKTNSEGKAGFEVRSTLAGLASFCVQADPEGGCFAGNPHPTVNFVPKIESIAPNSGARGSSLTQVKLSIAGLDISKFAAKDINVRMGQFQASNFYIYTPAVSVPADGTSQVYVSGATPAGITYPATVSFSITSKVGTPAGGFGPERAKSITSTLNGPASFVQAYYAGNQQGIAEINVSIAGTPATAKILVIEKKPAKFYQFDLTPNPEDNISLHINEVKQLVASLNDTAGNPVSGKMVSFLSNDDSVINPSTAQTQNGMASSSVQVKSAPGKAGVVAYYLSSDDGVLYADYTVIEKLPLNQSEQLTVSNVAVTPDKKVSFTLDIGAGAALGFWDVLADIGQWKNIELPGNEDFKVTTIGPNVPYLVSVNPTSGRRGQTIATFEVNGSTDPSTTFTQPDPGNGIIGSQLLFEPSPLAPPDTGDPHGITVTNLQVLSLTRLRAQVVIAADATPGWWNVAVHTEHQNFSEIASMPGDKDFLVTVGNNGYFIDLQSDKKFLPADGASKANLTATVGWLDETPGSGYGNYQFLPNLTVSFTSTDGNQSLSKLNGTTDSNGRVRTVYTVNTTVGSVTITASVTIPANRDPYKLPNPLTLTAQTVIQKGVAQHNLQFTVAANPSTIDLDSSQLFSTVTVTLKDKDGKALSGQIVTLSLDGGGSLDKSSLTIGPGGTATTTYVADFVTGMTKVNAYAVVPNIGPIQATPATITKTRGVGIKVTLRLFVPLEGQNRYDYETANSTRVIVIGQNESTPRLDNSFKISSSDEVLGLPATISVVSGRQYDVWVKAKQHLAVVKTFSSTQDGETKQLTFSTADGHSAYIGDIVGQTEPTNGSFNFINAQDWSRFYYEYLKPGLDIMLGDFNHDGKVDSRDYSFFYRNYFKRGETYPL